MKPNFVKKYLAEFLAQLRLYPFSFELWRSVFLFPIWKKYLSSSNKTLQDELPWITFTSISYLSKLIDKNSQAFEYGSGGSTIYLAKRIRNLTSIEHDELWYRKLLTQVKSVGLDNVDLRFVPPVDIPNSSTYNPSSPLDFVSSVKEYADKSFKPYVDVICEYPDDYFDLILIDGRSRPSCFYRALEKVKIGGFIVWDNTDRQRYHYSMNLVKKGFRIFDFPGPAPYISYFSRTTIWLKSK